MRWLAGLLLMVAAGVALPAAAQPSRSATSFDQAIADAKSTMMTDPGKTIDAAGRAAVIAQRVIGDNRATHLATAQWLQGEAHLRLNEPAAAGPLLEAAFAALRQGPATKLKGDVLRSRGGYYAATANVAGALADYQAAYRIYLAVGETRSQAIALLSLAGLYQDAADFASALPYYTRALEAYRGDPQLLLATYNNRGDALKELGNYKAAEADFRAAFKLARDIDSPVLEAQILRNIARLQLLTGDLTAADRTIAQGFALLRSGGTSEFAGQLWAVSAQAALQRGHLVEARTMIERAFAGIDITHPTVVWARAHRTAYDIYRALGNAPEALRHLVALKQLDDQTNKLAASTETALMAARFDSAGRDLKIAKLQAGDAKRQADFARARANTQFWIFVGAGIVAVVIFGMLGFGLVTIRRSRDQVRAANVDLAATNSALGKALAAKTEFLATTSHEIRTPLNGILGMTQVMLADQRLDAATRDRIGVVHGAGVSMRALVDDILDVAKMETGNLTIERAPVDLPAMLGDVSRMWQEQATAKGLGFTLDTAGAPACIESDPARLRQVVFNLLSNALKFTQSGAIRVEAGVAGTGADERLTIAVRDTGIGIPADKLELVFESFRQADAGTTRQFGGTGLGLAICRNIARAMGGDVGVESVPGEGSVFKLTVPLIRVAAAPCAVALDAGEPRLLIVDRNPISRATLKTLFASRFANLQLAGSIDEAAAIVAAGGIARVLTDEPTLASAGTAEQGAAALADAPLSLLWPTPDDAVRARMAAAGVDQLIAKPIAGAALVQAIVTRTQKDGIARQAA